MIGQIQTITPIKNSELAGAVYDSGLYTKLIFPIQQGSLLQESSEAKRHARILYGAFRTKQVTSEAEASLASLLVLLDVKNLEAFLG